MKLIPESWIIFKILKMYLFLAVLGCHCCSQAFPSGGNWRLLSSCGARFFNTVACLVAEHGLECGHSTCGTLGLVAPQHAESSPTRN